MAKSPKNPGKVILFANTDWYLYNFRLALAQELKKGGTDVLLVSPKGDYSRQFAKAGIQWIPIDLTRRGSNPIKEFSTIWKFAAILKKEKPDLIHTFTLKCNLYGAMKFPMCRRILLQH
jgi:hypothetical protein